MNTLICDSTDLADIPAWCDIPATYANGQYAVPLHVVAARFPAKRLIRINVNGDPKFGNVLDVERYDAQPKDIPRWFDGRVEAGLDPHQLGVYFERDNIHACHSAWGPRPCKRWLATDDGLILTEYEGIHVDAVQAFDQRLLAGLHYDLSIVFGGQWVPSPFSPAQVQL